MKEIPRWNALLTWPRLQTRDLRFDANGSYDERVREIMESDDARSVALEVSHALWF